MKVEIDLNSTVVKLPPGVYCSHCQPVRTRNAELLAALKLAEDTMMTISRIVEGSEVFESDPTSWEGGSLTDAFIEATHSLRNAQPKVRAAIEAAAKGAER